uniref:Uncharacterized protein n=1 Tax=Arundo donax TaxID=35708 RepID=A0A0A9G2C4_ARUDO
MKDIFRLFSPSDKMKLSRITLGNLFHLLPMCSS